MATGSEPITEVTRADGADLDLRPTVEIVELINDEDATVAAAVRGIARELAEAIDAISERLARGGRLVYAGAGSSGRLAVVDAAECGPTFGAAPEQVVALVAGGATALATAQEAAEDDEDSGFADVTGLGIGPDDAVVALSASGGTPYAVGATPREWRVKSSTPSASSTVCSNFDAAGCVMWAASAACSTDRFSSSCTMSASCRALSRERASQSIGVFRIEPPVLRRGI